MNLLSRIMLLLTVWLVLYSAAFAVVLAIYQVPPDKQGLVTIIVVGGLCAIVARKKGRRLFTSGGTAAWASIAELARGGMLYARTGLILGRVPAEGAPIVHAVKALLNRRLYAKDACRAFFHNINPLNRKKGQLVRLPQAVHSMIVAPTGVGKGVSCILPFLLTCEESCVVVDFKGENALLTAEHRRRMGHKIVILDPFKVVTQ